MRNRTHLLAYLLTHWLNSPFRSLTNIHAARKGSLPTALDLKVVTSAFTTSVLDSPPAKDQSRAISGKFPFGLVFAPVAHLDFSLHDATPTRCHTTV